MQDLSPPSSAQAGQRAINLSPCWRGFSSREQSIGIGYAAYIGNQNALKEGMLFPWVIDSRFQFFIGGNGFVSNLVSIRFQFLSLGRRNGNEVVDVMRQVGIARHRLQFEAGAWPRLSLPI